MAEEQVSGKLVRELMGFQETVIAFVDALNHGLYFRGSREDAVRDALYILEKPWKWQEEMAEWEVLGFPGAYNPNFVEDLEIDISDAKILSFFNR